MQTHLTKMQGRFAFFYAKIFTGVIMAIYRTDDKTIWKMENSELVWRFTGKQIDEFLDDLKRMENLITDLVKPEPEIFNGAEVSDNG